MKKTSVLKVSRRLTAFAISAALITGLIPLSGKIGLDNVDASVKTEVKSVNINVNNTIAGIDNPDSPDSAKAWSGSFVFYGKYNSKPVKYRVLDNASSEFGSADTMLLDCDTVLEQRTFNSGSIKWAGSETERYLNGDFYNKSFSDVEKNLIVTSNKASVAVGDGNLWSQLTFAPLVNDKVFILDVSEASRSSYGYSNDEIAIKNRVKDGGNKSWWIRSPYTVDGLYIGFVDSNGSFYYDDIQYKEPGISPAINIKKDNIAFSVEDGFDKTNGFEVTKEADLVNSWKLCLNGGSGFSIDDNQIDKMYNTGDYVSFGIKSIGTALTGVTYTQLSAMLVEADTNTVAAYGKISDDINSNTASVLLPSVKTGNYFLRVFAEDVNSTVEDSFTDYSSNMVSVPISINNTAPELKHFDYKDSTCKEQGNIEYWWDESTDKYYSDSDAKNEISKDSIALHLSEHSYGDWIINMEPTFYEFGMRTRTCKICSYIQEDELGILIPEKSLYNEEEGAGLEIMNNSFTGDYSADIHNEKTGEYFDIVDELKGEYNFDMYSIFIKNNDSESLSPNGYVRVKIKLPVREEVNDEDYELYYLDPENNDLVKMTAHYSEGYVYCQTKKPGRYVVVDTISEKIIEENYVSGDVNNDTLIDAKDALDILKNSANLIDFDETQKKAADVNKDEVVNANDALLVLKYAANLIPHF